MVLNQLKGRLKTARRGHKLLKDKRDELMRQFMDVVKRNKQLRIRVEEGLTAAFGHFPLWGKRGPASPSGGGAQCAHWAVGGKHVKRKR